MMHVVILRPRAEDDIRTAFHWYRSQQPMLGEEFLVHLRRALERIGEFPESSPSPTVVIFSMTSPLVQIEHTNFNLGTSMPYGSTASSRGSPFHSFNTDPNRRAFGRADGAG